MISQKGPADQIRVWELGVAIAVGSTLDDREFVGQELKEVSTPLGNLRYGGWCMLRRVVDW